MASQVFPFIGGAYQSRSRSFDIQQCINLYVEQSESGPGPSKTTAMLVGTPGRVLWLSLPGGEAIPPGDDVPGGAVRGLKNFTSQLGIAVVGINVWGINADKSNYLIGNIDDDGQVVSMDTNGSAMFIGTSTNTYAVDPVLKTIMPLGYATTDVGFIDGYMLLNKLGTGQMYYTDEYSTNIDPLNFFTAEGSPDNLLAWAPVHREAWLFGEKTTEVFFPTGNAVQASPFARIGNAFIELGIAAPHAWAKMDNTVYWLAADERGFGTVVRANNYEPERVSTHAIEFAINSYATISDAIALTYQQEGHNFFQLTFPSAGVTWVFDSSSALWHQRAYRNPTTAQLEQVREQCQMTFQRLVLVGDRANGHIYQLDLNTFTDFGDPIARIRTCSHLVNAQQQQQYNRLELMMDVGVGLTRIQQGTDPQAMLQISDDGGATWTNERWAPIGKIGETQRRVSWRRLGQAIDRVYRVTITDPIPVAISGAVLS